MVHPGAYRGTKRQKELKRLQKQEEKRQKRLQKIEGEEAGHPAGTGPEIDWAAAHPGEVSSAPAEDKAEESPEKPAGD